MRERVLEVAALLIVHTEELLIEYKAGPVPFPLRECFRGQRFNRPVAGRVGPERIESGGAGQLRILIDHGVRESGVELPQRPKEVEEQTRSLRRERHAPAMAAEAAAQASVRLFAYDADHVRDLVARLLCRQKAPLMPQQRQKWVDRMPCPIGAAAPRSKGAPQNLTARMILFRI